MRQTITPPIQKRYWIGWRSIRVVTALTLASGALTWAGVTLVGNGEPRLGWWMIAVGLAMFIAAGQERW